MRTQAGYRHVQARPEDHASIVDIESEAHDRALRSRGLAVDIGWLFVGVVIGSLIARLTGWA